ncbi:hypothetical protein DXG03_008511 [Asterophora parasitica]|uniref:Uncharacterized protein n=1 Tax=Asterophora parasitica TaxID=117018 RepID=A0A9P7KE24_9AGAR|nr:hypothetical protein DXG03_008511 [Asterophora parasitica]
MEYVPDAALCGNSVGIKPTQVTLLPSSGHAKNSWVATVHKENCLIKGYRKRRRVGKIIEPKCGPSRGDVDRDLMLAVVQQALLAKIPVVFGKRKWFGSSNANIVNEALPPRIPLSLADS